MIIEKVDGGYIVEYDDRKQIATAEHVANLITRFMRDVADHIERIIIERHALMHESPDELPK
jgi:hypothetical protein